jgi:hypothetical protein
MAIQRYAAGENRHRRRNSRGAGRGPATVGSQPGTNERRFGRIPGSPCSSARVAVLHLRQKAVATIIFAMDSAKREGQ